MQPFQPEAFDAASGVAEKSGGTSPLLDREYLFGGNAGVETAGSVPHSTDQRAHVEAADQWYALPPAPMPQVTMEDPNGQWFAWDGSKALTITLPDRRDIRSVWFPTSLGVIEIFSGLTEGGVPLYTSNALAECAPIPSGNKTLTLVSQNGAFANPMAVYATNDVLAPSRSAASPIATPTSMPSIATSAPNFSSLFTNVVTIATGVGASTYFVVTLPADALDPEIFLWLGSSGPWNLTIAMGSQIANPGTLVNQSTAGNWFTNNPLGNALYTTFSAIAHGALFSPRIPGSMVALANNSIVTEGIQFGNYLVPASSYLFELQNHQTGSGNTSCQMALTYKS